VLTRLPVQPRIIPSQARQLIREHVISRSQIVSLTASEYIDLIEWLAANGILGGATYDAIIVKAAQSARADCLATFNVADFRRLWPAEAYRIVTPDEISA